MADKKRLPRERETTSHNDSQRDYKQHFQPPSIELHKTSLKKIYQI